MNDQSQVQYGPIRLSFGNLHDQVNYTKKTAKLTDNEYLLLQCFIQAISRPEYKSDINSAVRPWKPGHFEEKSGLARQNLSRAFQGLVKKKVMTLFSSKKGCESYYSLSPVYIAVILSERVQQDFHRLVAISSKCNQSDDTTVINLMTPCNQSDDTTVINLMTPCNQSDDTDLYIEDSLISLNLPTLPRSLPGVDNGDNFDDGLSGQIASMSEFFGNPSDAAPFVRKLVSSRFFQYDKSVIDSFARWLHAQKVGPTSTLEINKKWLSWDESFRNAHVPSLIDFHQPQAH